MRDCSNVLFTDSISPNQTAYYAGQDHTTPATAKKPVLPIAFWFIIANFRLSLQGCGPNVAFDLRSALSASPSVHFIEALYQTLGPFVHGTFGAAPVAQAGKRNP